MKKLLNRVVLVLPYARRLRAERVHGEGTVNKQELVRAFAIATVALLGLLLGTSIAASVPKANCGPHDRTESGLQGETTQEERFSGDSELGYNCNLELVGHEPQGSFEGAYSQDGPAYAGDCAYYGTDNVTSLQQHLGVRVIDASDPRHPRVTAYLDDTAAARAPHETVKTHEGRHLLAVAENNGPGFAVYDISDCRHPVLWPTSSCQAARATWPPSPRTAGRTGSVRPGPIAASCTA